MSGLPFDAETTIHDCLILQFCHELACGMQRGSDLVTKLVGHINKSKEKVQQVDKLTYEVHSLDEALRKARRDNR